MIKIDISNVKGSELSLLLLIIEQEKWQDVEDKHAKANLVWNFKNHDKFTQTSINRNRLQIRNRIKGMGIITQKIKITEYIRIFGWFYPQINQIYPETYIYPKEKYLIESKNLKQFIAKPSKGSEGIGIFFPKSALDLEKKCNLMVDDYVIQKYINNPMLLNNKKFDLRFYVLIQSLNPYIVYINKEGLVRVCVQDYNKNSNDQHIHLTNYSLNKDNDNYIPCTEDFLNDSNSNKQSFSSFKQQLKQQGINYIQIFEKIEKLIADFMTVIYPHLLYYNTENKEQLIQNFHILGIDILLQNTGEPILLEANSAPSLQIHQFVNNNIEISPLDSYVKQQVVTDAINIVFKKLKWEQTSYILISEKYQLVNNNILDLLYTFQFCGNSQQTISWTQFSKIMNFYGMLSNQIQRVDYQLCFSMFQTLRIDFCQFCELIRKIGIKMNVDLSYIIQLIRI